LGLIVSIGLVVSVGIPAFAAAKPAISRVGSGSGPLTRTNVVIQGSSLGNVTAVRFGRLSGVIIGRPARNSVTVKTPAGATPGTVSVLVKNSAGWSSPSDKARYTFVAAPRLSSIAPVSGYYSGGTRVTLTGKNLSTAKQVLFGRQPATILARRVGTLIVKTPIGTLGSSSVTVKTTGGVATNSRVTFEYVRPPVESAFEVQSRTGTLVATDVNWVSGGYDADTDTTTPWLVELPSGAATPTVGQRFLLRPGNAAFPSGLAGSVTEVADQLDQSVRVTVVSADLEQVVDNLTVDYSGPVVDPNAATARSAARAGAAQLETGKAFEFSLKGPTALSCKDAQDSTVSFGADLTTTVTDVDVDQHLKLGNLIRKPTYDGAFTAEVQTTGKITVAAAATCKIKATWANAHRKIIPLGTSGATLSFGPSFEFKISGRGTWSIQDRTRTTFAVNATLGKTPTFTRAARSVESRQSGELAFEAELNGGVSVQFGLLDRAGLQGKILLGATASVTASSAPNVCVDGELFGKLTIGVFLDTIVYRWEADAFSVKLSILKVHGCLASEGPVFSTEPNITSARLTDAVIGVPYNATLTTADGRPGTWSIVRFALPAGLTLSPGGAITGTPQGSVQDYAVIVDFKDASGAVATTTIRIRVMPSQGLGGGDIQATLRWSGASDLDLHVTDPSGEEIYYAHPTSTSGGQLDHDANAGCNGPADDDNPVENIYWPTSGAPAGAYTVWVKVYATCGAPLDWHLTVRRNGVTIVDQSGTGDSAQLPFSAG
jgi:hypothetical protein